MLRTSMPGNDDAGEETTQARIHIGNYDKVKAVSVLEREEPLLTTVDPYLAMAVLWMLGVHRRRSGDLAKAFADLQRALDLAHRLEETHYVASLTADVANVHLESGDPVKALASYEDSAHLLTSIGRHGTADQVMINVATANQRLGRDAEAEAVYENLLEKYSATYSRSLRSAVQLNLAVAKNKIGKTEDAVNIYQMVLQELAEERFSEATGRALVGLAGLYANQDRFSDALALLEEARAGHDQLGNTSNVLELRGLQADVL